MYQVGTRVGDIHQPLRQGEGKATVLGPQTSDDYFVRYAMARRSAREKAIDDRNAKRTAALGKMMTAQPDFFYAHRKEVSDAYNTALSLGAEAMKAGANDPWNSTDEKSTAFQKAMAQAQEMGKFSTQIRDQYKAFQQDIQAKGPDYFDPNTITNSEGYFFGKSLADHMANPQTAPLVMQRKPLQNAIDISSSLAGKLSAGAAKDGVVDENVGKEIVRTAFRDPETGAATMKTYTMALANYPEAERMQLENEARDAGLSAPEMYAWKTTQAFLKSKSPYSVQESLAAGDKLFEPSTKEWRGAETFSVKPDQAKSLQSAMSIARGILNDDPRSIGAFSAYYRVKQDPAETETEFLDELARKMGEDLYTRAKKTFQSGETAGGGKNAAADARANDWLQTMLSQDPYYMGQAASALQGIKYIGNLDVNQANVIPDLAGNSVDPATGTLVQPYVLNLQLKTPLSVKIGSQQEAQQYILGEIQKETGTTLDPASISVDALTQEGAPIEGATSTDVAQGAGGYNVYIKVAPDNAQLLETLYRRADKSGNIWKGRKNLPKPNEFQPPVQSINKKQAGKVTPVFQF